MSSMTREKLARLLYSANSEASVAMGYPPFSCWDDALPTAQDRCRKVAQILLERLDIWDRECDTADSRPGQGLGHSPQDAAAASSIQSGDDAIDPDQPIPYVLAVTPEELNRILANSAT